MPDTSGVGISFGADRIYDVLTGLDLYPKDAMQSTQVLFINFGRKEELASLQLVNQLRAQGIPSEIYPDAGKMKKQMEYANRRGIPYVVLIGENEAASRTATVKNMATGEQQNVPFDALAARWMD
jgi:histidyl-tRNA synthetase